MKDSTDLFGSRMKDYESAAEYVIPKEEHIIVRIDGSKFSKFTKGFKYPFDDILNDTFADTVEALMKRFSAITGYHQSDEITLLLPATTSKDGLVNYQVFAGRTQKLASMIAAYTTKEFNNILRNSITNKILENNLPRETSYWYTIEEKAGTASFDARCFGVPSEDEVFNSFLWRIHDCKKNSKSMFSHAHCGHKKLLNKTGEEKINFCKETTGYDWHSIAERYKWGTLFKRENYLKGEAIRTKFIRISKDILYSEENVTLVNTKKIGIL